MSLGLKKDTVKLEAHQDAWDIEGAIACKKIKDILGDDVVDVQHVGSTSIRWICVPNIRMTEILMLKVKKILLRIFW